MILGKEKLQIPANEPVRLVLESDGTQVEDGEYFKTLANHTVILLLRPGERWYPTGVDVIRTGTVIEGTTSQDLGLHRYRGQQL